MGESDQTAAKVQIEPDELRRLLAGQFRNEVTDAIWGRMRWWLTGAGAVALSIIGGVFSWINGTIEDAAKKAVDAQRPGLLAEAQNRSNQAAADAVRADITRVEDVRRRVAEGLPPLIAEALQANAVSAIIQRETAAAMQARLGDERWWRESMRPVFSSQALDPTLPLGLRHFSFEFLLAEAEGVAMARDVLLRTARAVPEAGLPALTDEARLLKQLVLTYGVHLARGGAGRGFAEHAALLERLVEVSGPDGEEFAALVHRFEDAAAVSWLVRRARQGTGAARQAAIAALASHPAAEAQQQVQGLLCIDPGIRSELIAAMAARRDGMAADQNGAAFVAVVRCLEQDLVERRLPRIDPACLPWSDLLTPWRLTRLQPGRSRAERETAERLHAQLGAAPPACAWPERLPVGSEAALREPGAWSILHAAAGQRDRVATAFEALLPAGRDGAAPAWLSDLAAGRGPVGGLLDDAGGKLIYLKLLHERLASAPAGWGELDGARARLARAVALAPLTPGRPAERLLLDMLASGQASYCDAALRAFLDSPRAAAAAPAALAEAIACRSRGNADDAAIAEALVRTVAGLSAGLMDNPAYLRRVLAAIAEGGGLRAAGQPIDESIVVQVVTLWLRDHTGLSGSALALGLGQLARAGLAEVASIVEEPTSGALRTRLAALPDEDRAALTPAFPYLDTGFAARVPSGEPVNASGRVWRRAELAAPGRLILPRDPIPVVIAVGGAETMPLRHLAHGIETATLPSGTYLVGTLRESEARAAPAPAVPAVGATADTPLTPVQIGRTYAATLGPEREIFVAVPLRAHRPYVFETFNVRDLDTVIQLHDPSGRAIANARDDDKDFGPEPRASLLCFEAPLDGEYRVRFESFGTAAPRPSRFEFRISEMNCPPRR